MCSGGDVREHLSKWFIDPRVDTIRLTERSIESGIVWFRRSGLHCAVFCARDRECPFSAIEKRSYREAAVARPGDDDSGEDVDMLLVPSRPSGPQVCVWELLIACVCKASNGHVGINVLFYLNVTTANGYR